MCKYGHTAACEAALSPPAPPGIRREPPSVRSSAVFPPLNAIAEGYGTERRSHRAATVTAEARSRRPWRPHRTAHPGEEVPTGIAARDATSC